MKNRQENRLQNAYPGLTMTFGVSATSTEWYYVKEMALSEPLETCFGMRTQVKF